MFGYSRCEEGVRCVEQAIPIVQATGNRFEESCCYGLLALEYGFKGRFIESFSTFDKAVCVARDGHEHSIECWDLWWRAQVHALKGEWEKAAARANEAISLAQRIENIWAVTWNKVIISYARFIGSRDPALIEQVRQAAEALGRTVSISLAYCSLGDMLYLIGSAREAAVAADRALAELKNGCYWSTEAKAYRIRSMAVSQYLHPDWESVRRDMEKSISIAQSQQHLPDLAISRLRYAEVLLREGVQEEARAQLAEAQRLFADMDMIWWLGEAKNCASRLI